MMRKRILLIDDETEFAEMMQMRLEANNYEVALAHDGDAGLAKAAAGDYHLVLLDVMMPGVDGFEVLRRLRRDTKTRRVPVIMLTAKGEFKSISDAQAMGATDYVIKPCESADLIRLINKYIN
jgi:DNA-binding response OmpR family regulator